MEEDNDMVDRAIYQLLYNIDKPEDGLTIREMTRIIWKYKENAPSDERFYDRAKLLERRISAIRHRIFEKIRKELKEKNIPSIGKQALERPAFIPYALQTGKYWRYLNAANYEQMPWVIKGLRNKAYGLNANAEVLEAVF